MKDINLFSDESVACQAEFGVAESDGARADGDPLPRVIVARHHGSQPVGFHDIRDDVDALDVCQICLKQDDPYSSALSLEIKRHNITRNVRIQIEIALLHVE